MRLNEEEYQVLKILKGCGTQGAGRNKLHSLLLNNGYQIGTGKIRTILGKLEEKKLIKQHPNGCVITEKEITIFY